MKTTTQTVRYRTYVSEVRPSVTSRYQSDAPVLKWADEHPVVWGVVTTRRSKAFGIGSCEYIGLAQRSMASDAILERVRHIHHLVAQPALRPDCDIHCAAPPRTSASS